PRSTRTSRRRSMRVTGSLLDAGALKTTHRSVSCEPGIRGRRNAMVHSLRRKFSCPVELSLEMLGGKWKTVILAYLKHGSLRYAELRALIPRLSDKVLTERLRDLEELGLVVRQKSGGRGAPSRYALTGRGKSLGPVLQGLYDWGHRIAPEVGATVEAAGTLPSSRRDRG